MRQQHYRFAHTVLMNNVLRDPGGFWNQMETLGGVALRQSWEEAGAGLGPADLVEGGPPGLQRMTPAPDAAAFVVTMPPPMDAAECYFVAIVRAGQNPPRYFVAERGVDADGGVQRAYWAEWKVAPGGGGVMRVRGADLPAITPEALLAAAVQECQFLPPGGPAPGQFGPPGGPAPGQFGPPGGPAPGPFGPPGGPAPGQFGPQGAPGAWGQGPMGAQGGMRMGPMPGQPKKKSRVLMFVGCGCLSLFLFVLSVGGILLYYEEGKGLHVPDSEVVSQPVQPGGSYSVEFTWDGTGWAFNNVWLVIDEGQKSGGQFEVETTMKCDRGGREEKKTVKVPSYDVKQVEDNGSSFSAWIYLGDEYERGSSRKITCSGTVTPTKGSWTKAHIAVTQRQRPADFFAF